MSASPVAAPPSRIAWFVFETALGAVGIAWTEAGLMRLVLPSPDAETATRRLTAKLEGAARVETLEDAPPRIAEAVSLIRRYAEGEAVDLSAVPVSMDGVEPFGRAIYRAARKLGHGETVTYGELAERAGFPRAARETGAALGRNPVPLVVPCHRILAAGGNIGGFSAPGGAVTKEKLLAHEGVRVGPPPPAQASFAF